MSLAEQATWHRLTSWREDAPLDLRCRTCGVAIQIGDTYRIAGIFVLCTLRPFCPAPAAPVVVKDAPRLRVRKRLRRLIIVGKPVRTRVSRLPLVTCVCGVQFRRRRWRGTFRQHCSWACAFPSTRRTCAVCPTEFAIRSEHPQQVTCSPSCGARLREQRKREARAA